jgi:nicotinate-nucleotide pyrophosphorylase (carboxylating)
MVFQELDDGIVFNSEMHDGERFSPGMTLAMVTGSAATCLRGERTALNLLQHLSGIATLTREFVDAAEGRIKILDTRKTLPGLRVMEKYAVRTGGGHNHRFGLYDMVLIKDNHIEIAGSIGNAVHTIRKKRRKTFIEVEIQTFKQLQEILTLPVDRIMLDNMSVEQIAEAVKIVRRTRPALEIEVSGGIKLDGIEPLCSSGIDYVSVGALTHSARAVDIAMQLKLIRNSVR